MPSQSNVWNKPWSAVLLALILLPPLGLVLLWKRPSAGLALKAAGTLGAVVLNVAHLVILFGLRMELDGSGSRPIFYFGGREAHYREIEESRSHEPAPAPAQEVAASLAASAESAAPVAPPAPPATAAAVRTEDAYWTDYRGPLRDGHYRQMRILTTWPAKGLPELWRQPVGEGYASMVVAGGKVFTIEQRRDREVVAAYDFDTGRELWTDSWRGRFEESMGGPGPRTTPTWHEGELYALGAEGELRCLDANTGKVLWRKNILEDNGAGNLNWAMAASPLIVDDKVIVLPGGRPGRSVVAYHKLSGEPVWKALDDKQAYTAPMLVTLAGRRQVLVVSAERVMGLTVENGALLWDYPWRTSYDVNAAQPLIVGDNRFFISAGYGHGAAVAEVGRSGDRFTARTVWESNRMKNKFNSSVLHEGHVYGLDEAILACIDAETGEQKWKGGRYGYGQLLLADGHLVVITEQGDLVLVKATPDSHEELVRFSAIRGKTWNVPAMASGRLIVRNTREMACYRITP